MLSPTRKTMAGRVGHGRWLRVAAAVLAIVFGLLVAWRVIAAPTSRIDQDQAVALAREFFDGAHGSGATVSNVQVRTV